MASFYVLQFCVVIDRFIESSISLWLSVKVAQGLVGQCVVILVSVIQFSRSYLTALMQ